MGDRFVLSIMVYLATALVISAGVSAWSVQQRWEQLAESRQQVEMYQKIVADIRELSK